jgi:hypothetical protein
MPSKKRKTSEKEITSQAAAPYEPPNWGGDRRIYCVVANTVQCPLQSQLVTNIRTGAHSEVLTRTPDTKSIRQPAGRLVAQAAHAVSLARMFMMWAATMKALKTKDVSEVDTFHFCHSMVQPITTIILAARDSFELSHVFDLLYNAKIPVHSFLDTDQPDYGSLDYRVMTAIATEPLEPEEVLGILDYLPLWKPE